MLAASCGAHFLHDGASDLLYVLFPVWAAQLALPLAEVGLLKTVYSGCLAGFQLPSGLLAERFGERRMLVLGTALVGLALLLTGWAGGFLGLALCLALAGAGASVQHPIGSSLAAGAYEGSALRTALSTYNFSGDLGKVALPALAASLVALWQWRGANAALGAGLLAAAALLAWALAAPLRTRAGSPDRTYAAPAEAGLAPQAARRGFLALCAIAVFDSATRTGFLTFVPFLLGQKGASLPLIGVAMSLIFAGGATGKFVCGVMAARVGILRTVILTECATAAFILLLLPLGLTPALFLLPPIGLALNGTSSVLYGTVAELAPAERRARAFGIFYTIGIGAGAIAPAIYGSFSDGIGVAATLAIVALVVLVVLPLTLPLRGPLRALGQDGPSPSRRA